MNARQSIDSPAAADSTPTVTRQCCMNCGGSDLKLFLDLGTQPNGNNFITPDQIENEPTYSMRMLTCESCWQVQIDEFPPQSVLFDDHPYVSGLNVPVVEHFSKMAKKAVADFDLSAGDVVLDIGCNDGSLLSCFREEGMTTIGVDPGGRVTELARKNGHLACRAFWNSETAQAIKTLGIEPKIISATAVFYHVPDLHDFVEGLLSVMTDETVFVVQGVNLLDLIQQRQFDHFYHEHSCVHSISGLQKLFAAHGMKILDVSNYPIHGGSFVAYVARETSPHQVSDSVQQSINTERAAGLEKLSTFEEFSEAVAKNTSDLRSLLEDLKEQDATVYGLGAPLKGSTLLNYADIGPDLVSCLTEVNSFKIGRVSPGTHIPVVDERTLAKQPDYYLVLAWNFLDFFLEKKRSFLEAGGKFIVPVPSLQVLDASALKPQTTPIQTADTKRRAA
ncbi:class I SAM-dependent methyltransferase [Rosistilla oblonga]|uniref:class I SAM-dependent methyltransferase n=1 Tax=Rosistilla oblonga TaxID=2527990 RepID=UPI003A975AAB